MGEWSDFGEDVIFPTMVRSSAFVIGKGFSGASLAVNVNDCEKVNCCEGLGLCALLSKLC